MLFYRKLNSSEKICHGHLIRANESSGLIENSQVDDESWIMKNYTMQNSNVEKSLIVSDIKNCHVKNSIIKVRMKKVNVVNMHVQSYANLFTWIDLDHVKFKCLSHYQLLLRDGPTIVQIANPSLDLEY